MERKAYVDFAKFLAIFFVLASHIELTIPVISSFGGLFYVPIFFVLAGYTYRDKGEKFAAFTVNKAKRLLVPYFSANLFLFLFFFLKDSVLTGQITKDSFFPLLGILYSRNSLYPPGTEKNLFFLTNQNAPTWFLTAMFLSYLVFWCVVRFLNGCKEKGRILLWGVVVSGLLFLGICLDKTLRVLLPWSLESIPFFVLYMLAGYFMGCFKLEKKLAHNYGVWFLAFVSLYLGYRWCGAANISVGYFGRSTVFGFMNGVISSGLVLIICVRIIEPYAELFWIEKLCAIGRNTMLLMNYHLFVFMFLITACNLIWPQKLSENDLVSGGLKIFIVIFTIGVIQLQNTIKRKLDERWKR